jgi:hypothetical protein
MPQKILTDPNAPELDRRIDFRYGSSDSGANRVRRTRQHVLNRMTAAVLPTAPTTGKARAVTITYFEGHTTPFLSNAGRGSKSNS